MDIIIMNDSWFEEAYEFRNSLSFTSNDTYQLQENITVYESFEVPTTIIVFLSILYGTISILAVVGNSLVMWIVATSKRMQNVTNFYIANLALADIIIGLFAIPFQFQAALLQRWNLPYFMCAFCPFVQALSVNVSVFTLTAIAVDRHRAILKPLSAKPSKWTAKIIIAAIWVIAVGFAVPMAVARRVVMEPEGHDRYKPFCKEVNLSRSSMLIYSAILVFMQYLTPLSVISCAYARMALKLWGNKAPGNAEDSRDAALMRNKMRVIKMLIIVVALFAICWLPLQTYNVIRYFHPQINEYDYIHYIFFSSDWLAMSNSCYNPFIYGIYNENFKREFQQRCPFLTRKRSNNTTGVTAETDRTQSSRTSIRYKWKRTISSSYPVISSCYKGVTGRESSQSFINDHQTSTRNKKGIGYFIRSRNHCSLPSNRNKELSVFSVRKQKHVEESEVEELCV